MLNRITRDEELTDTAHFDWAKCNISSAQLGGVAILQGYGNNEFLTPYIHFFDRRLYRFTGGADDGHPLAPLVFDGHGNLYGTTWIGGLYNGGTVFKLTR